MNLSTPTNTLGSINATRSTVFKDFKDLSFAIRKNQNLAENLIQSKNGQPSEPIVRHYNLIHASRYLGRSEAALRLFLWENGLKPDVRDDKDPLFSEEFLDLIDGYGYLFDYSKKWRQSGYHQEAENLLREAREVFGLPATPAAPSHTKRKNKAGAQEQSEEWAGAPDEWEAKPLYIYI